jgi:hypothetical protein
MKFNNIISFCLSRDIEVWKVASKNIIKFIDSEKYTVIVPKKDLSLFKKNSPAEYKILSEEFYIPKFINNLLDKSVKSKTKVGWYIQQFLKFSALEEISDDKFALIWDADTIPLKKLTFEKNNKIAFYKGYEFHKPYFDHISILLGLKKNNNFSYIAQCMPVKGKWFKELIKSIENKNHKNWVDAIILKINFEELNAFSEYEMIGTFVEKNFPNEIEILDNNWQRYGKSIIGSVNNFKYFDKLLALKYDYISFEHWDKFSLKNFIITNFKEIKNQYLK